MTVRNVEHGAGRKSALQLALLFVLAEHAPDQKQRRPT